MSGKKNTTPGELRDVDVHFVSLVDKGANRRQFKIFKRIGEKIFGKQAQAVETSTEEDDDLSFADRIAEVQTEQAIAESLGPGFWTLREVCENILTREGVEDRLGLLAQAIDEFRAWFLARVSSVGIAKAVEELATANLEKVGRKISAARLKTLKDAYALLGQIIAEAEEENKAGGEKSVAKIEDLVKTIQALTEKMNKIEELVKKEEKGEEKSEGTPQGQGQEGAQGTETVEESQLAELAKAVQALTTRVEQIEKARGTPNRIPEEKKTTVEKGFWGGIFLP